MSDKLVANNKLLKELVEEAKKKLAAKEEELKASEVELEKTRVEVVQLEGKLARSRGVAAEVPTLRAQLEAGLNQARIAAAMVVSEFLA